jgi:hypothetical protein
MNGLVWVASVVSGALSIVSMVGGHVVRGLLLLALATALGLAGASTSPRHD